MTIPCRIVGACICRAARFDVAINLQSLDDPQLKARRTQEEQALGLKPFETFSGSLWQVCDRPECLDLAKKYDDENRRMFT